MAGRDGTPEALDAESERARSKPLRAPVIVAVAVEPVVGPKIVEVEEVAAGAAAVQNMLLAAHALGLAAIWRTGDACYDDAVKAHFDLSPNAYLMGFVYLGYPAAVSTRSRHTPPEELTRWLGWDD
jgi:nitroreductase